MASAPHHAALGSSFASGPLIAPIADASAGRSARNYAHVLAERVGARLTDLTVAGATTANLLHEPQTTWDGAVLPPQLAGLPADADLVTLTAGGNDLGFIGLLMHQAAERTGRLAELRSLLPARPVTGPDAPRPARVRATAAGLADVVDGIRAAAPEARVVLVDYLTVLPAEPNAVVAELFTPADHALGLRFQQAVAEAFRVAAEQTGAELLAASALSVDHGLGTPAHAAEPWVRGFDPAPSRLRGSLHPTAAGMAAVADALQERVAR